VRFDAVAGTTYYFEVSSFFPVSSADLTFNLLLAPPPLSIAPVVTQFGSVGPSTGTASIFGFVTCTQPAFVTISGQLKQTHGNVPVTGFFSAFVPCNGTTPWSANIQTTTTLFHGRAADLFTGGKADVSFAAALPGKADRAQAADERKTRPQGNYILFVSEAGGAGRENTLSIYTNMIGCRRLSKCAYGHAIDCETANLYPVTCRHYRFSSDCGRVVQAR